MTQKPKGLFVDTGAFYARVDADDTHHETATRLFEGIRSGSLSSLRTPERWLEKTL